MHCAASPLRSSVSTCLDLGWLRLGCAHWQPVKYAVVPLLTKPLCVSKNNEVLFRYSGEQHNLMNMTASRGASTAVCEKVFCEDSKHVNNEWCLYWVQAFFMAVVERAPACQATLNDQCQSSVFDVPLIACDWKQRIIADTCPQAEATLCATADGMRAVTSELQYGWLAYLTVVWSGVVFALVLSTCCCACIFSRRRLSCCGYKALLW